MGTKRIEIHNTDEEKLDLADSKFTIFAKKFYRKHIKGVSPVRQILLWYFLITLLGTAFLCTPWVLKAHPLIDNFDLDVFKLEHTEILGLPIWSFLVSHNIINKGDQVFPVLGNYLERPGFLDSLFVASSAFSDTGLTTVGISFTYNWFGQLVLLLLLEVGGIGWFSIKIFVLLFFVHKLKYSSISQSSYEKGMRNNQLAIGVIKTAVIVTIGSTIVFGLIFGVMFATIEPINLLPTDQNGLINTDNPEAISIFYLIPDTNLAITHLGPSYLDNWFFVPAADGVGLQGNWLDSFRAGFFHAGASINNSGLDIFRSSYSLAGYYGNYGIQIITMMLFILGGIGFSVIYDIEQYFQFKATGQKFRFSVITKISVVTYALVAFSGLFFVFLIESISIAKEGSTAFLENPLYGATFQRVFALVFNTFSTRNAGFSTINISFFSSATQITYMLMMFIGSGPGSTAGGLRTTTFFVIIVSTISQLKGKKNTNAFKKTISEKQCSQARSTFIFSLMLILAGTMFVFIAEDVAGAIITEGPARNDYEGVLSSFFVVTSAFGTTGLSPVSLSDITVVSKLVLIVIMFLGKMGMATTVEQFEPKKPIDRRYIEEYINLG